ncbi:glycosyltransferase [Metaplanococcus flavidus]|uniref:Glycosyltransferase n=1 Tax=Metaplanococcus flavidus TaxID=569883 RepID=A0ABW3LC65_9BACL
MKILQVNTFCGIESTGRIAVDIHSVLEEQGHDSFIAYGRDQARNCSNAIKIGGDFNNYVHVALSRTLDKHGFGSKKATEEFLAKVEKLKPDVIHLHNIHGYYLNIELLFNYLKKLNKPVIWTLHDCWSFTGHCANFDYINCDKWKTNCRDCPQLASYPKSLLVDNSKENFQRKREIFRGVENLTIVTPSKWLGDLVKKSYLSDYSLQVINNGIDLAVFKPTEGDFITNNNLGGKYILLGVANVWTEKKGLDDFIELSSLLRDDTVLVLVGLDDSQRKELPANILPISKTKDAVELAEIYTAADIFLNPTYEDNFPTTNLEAMACGTPVITYNTGGSIESASKECGVIVEKGDVKGLFTAVNEIREKGKKFYEHASIQRATKLYNKNDRFLEYTELYRKMNKEAELHLMK